MSFRSTIRLMKAKKITRLGAPVFAATIAYSMIVTVWSLYIQTMVKTDAGVGLVNSFFTLISLASFFLIVPLVEKSDKYKLALIATLCTAIGFLGYAFITTLVIFLIFETIMEVVRAARISSMGLLIKNNSKRSELSKNEGLIYTLFNVSFVIGPLIGGYLLSDFGMKYVFIGASLSMFIAVFLLKKAKINHGTKRKNVDKRLLKNFVDFFRNKDRVKSYIIGSGLNFWWCLIYIFMPLIIVKQLDVKWVGIFMSLVSVPLIFGEYHFGKVAGRKGYKKIFFLGYLIAGVCAALAFLFFNIYFVMLMLVLASVGAAMLESTAESYFFDISKGKDEQRFYAPYNTSIDAGSVMGKLLPSLFLFFVDIRYVLIIFAVGTFAVAIISLTIRDVIEKSEKEKSKG